MAPRRDSESATNSNEERVNNALSARRRPPRLVWSEERERKRTLGSPIFDIRVDAEHFFFFAATRATAACSVAKFPCLRVSMRDRCSVVVLEWASIVL